MQTQTTRKTRKPNLSMSSFFFANCPQIVQVILEHAGDAVDWQMVQSLAGISEFEPYVTQWWHALPRNAESRVKAERLKFFATDRDLFGSTGYAVREGDFRLLDDSLLRARMLGWSNPQMIAAQECLRFGGTAVMRHLVTAYSMCGNEALRLGAAAGDIPLIALALRAGATDLNQALHVAAANNQQQAAIHLVTKGASNGKDYRNVFGPAFTVTLRSCGYLRA